MKLLLDTNVLLNGIFNPLSFSSKLLKLSNNHTVQCCVLEYYIEEAHVILTRVLRNTGVDLHQAFDSVRRVLPLLLVEAVKEEELHRFKVVGGKKDARIAAAAVRDKITVCTHDSAFFKKDAKALGIDAKDTAEAVHAARGYRMEMDIVFPGFLMTPAEGSFYVDATAGWNGFINSKNLNGLWCIFDAVGIGGLYLDLDRGGLAYFADKGPEGFVSLKDCPSGEQQLRVVVSYDSNNGLGIYMGHGKPRFKQEVKWFPSNTLIPRKVTFWSGRKGDFGAATKTRLMAGFAKKVTESGANSLLGGNLPIIPSERLELEELVKQIYL